MSNTELLKVLRVSIEQNRQMQLLLDSILSTPEVGTELITPREAAKITSLSESTIIRMCEDGSIPGKKFNTKWRVFKKALVTPDNQGANKR